MSFNSEFGIALKGDYHVTKCSASGEVVEDRKFKNVVLDVGWEHLKRYFYNYGYKYPEYCFLGTGTDEPLVTDTGLQSRSETLPAKEVSGVGYQSITHDNGNGDPEYYGTLEHKVTLRFEYGQGEAEGVWTETGVSFDEDYTKPYNRSLFRDADGLPIAITVLSDEYLTIRATLTMYLELPENIVFQDGDTENTAVPRWDSSFSQNIQRSIWRLGWPVYVGTFNASGSGTSFLCYTRSAGSSDTPSFTTTNCTPIFDKENLLFGADVSMPPGPETSIYTIYIQNYDNRHERMIFFELENNLVREEDYKMTFTFTIQMFRAPLPELANA